MRISVLASGIVFLAVLGFCLVKQAKQTQYVSKSNSAVVSLQSPDESSLTSTAAEAAIPKVASTKPSQPVYPPIVTQTPTGLLSVDQNSTHAQTRIIELGAAIGKENVNAFCLTQTGEIVAATGTGPGHVFILDDQGKSIRSWELEQKPEAIGMTPEGNILVGAVGKLYKFSSEGKLLLCVDSPHATTLRENTDALRQEAIDYNKRYSQTNSASALKIRIGSYERSMRPLELKEKSGTLSERDVLMLNAIRTMLETAKSQLAVCETEEKDVDANGYSYPSSGSSASESKITQTIKMLTQSKMRIASISTDGQSVFIATPSARGHGFAVWKLNEAMDAGKEIISGLSGCCGQMDVQANDGKLYVAENSRMRVVCYDSDGKKICEWGKGDRSGVDGFSSCCNPMNVCFNKSGDVFTAESNTGRIKRFSADGNFLNYVGDVKLVPGCKNVSIAVSPDHSRVYMLDLTRNHIVVMDAKSENDSNKESFAAAVN